MTLEYILAVLKLNDGKPSKSFQSEQSFLTDMSHLWQWPWNILFLLKNLMTGNRQKVLIRAKFFNRYFASLTMTLKYINPVKKLTDGKPSKSLNSKQMFLTVNKHLCKWPWNSFLLFKNLMMGNCQKVLNQSKWF